MADLSKPKEAPVVKPVEERPPETDEEREKRLRKEARRKLRVTWKPDDSLTEVRLFTHDPDEELGPGDNSLRGVGDVKGEGSVLKLHKDLEDLEEDDLGGIRETSLHNYTSLTGESAALVYLDPMLTQIAIDMDLADLKTANFIKRGGEALPDSPAKEAQNQREATTLMAFYTSPADIPPSPKEPPASETSANDETAPELVFFGEVPDHVKVCYNLDSSKVLNQRLMVIANRLEANVGLHILTPRQLQLQLHLHLHLQPKHSLPHLQLVASTFQTSSNSSAMETSNNPPLLLNPKPHLSKLPCQISSALSTCSASNRTSHPQPRHLKSL